MWLGEAYGMLQLAVWKEVYPKAENGCIQGLYKIAIQCRSGILCLKEN